MNYTAANNEDLETPLLLEMDERRDKNNSEAKMILKSIPAFQSTTLVCPLPETNLATTARKISFECPPTSLT